jgi:hypothetical protein
VASLYVESSGDVATVILEDLVLPNWYIKAPARDERLFPAFQEADTSLVDGTRTHDVRHWAR